MAIAAWILYVRGLPERLMMLTERSAVFLSLKPRPSIVPSGSSSVNESGVHLGLGLHIVLVLGDCHREDSSRCNCKNCSPV